MWGHHLVRHFLSLFGRNDECKIYFILHTYLCLFLRKFLKKIRSQKRITNQKKSKISNEINLTYSYSIYLLKLDRCIPHLLNDAVKSWSGWSFKMIKKISITTTATIGIQVKILKQERTKVNLYYENKISRSCIAKTKNMLYF